MFSVGDGHGCQGDGEVCVSAIETGLTGTFEFVLHKDRSLTLPRAETHDAYITMAFDVDLDEAGRTALRRSEESRVGKECVSTCRAWWSPCHKKKQTKFRFTLKE